MPKKKKVDVNEFDVYLMPDPARFKKMRKISLMFLLPGLLALAIAWYFWDEYTTEIVVRSLRRGTYDSHEGWPVWVQTAGIWLSAIGGFAFLFVVLKNMKIPMIGVSKEGVFFNQDYVRRYVVPWDDIIAVNYNPKHINRVSIKLSADGRKRLLKGHFGMTRSILKANVDEKTPLLRLQSDLQLGAIDDVVQTVLSYWESHEAED